MWSGKQLADSDNMKKYVNDDTKINKAFKKMREIISAWRYHQDATTKQILKKHSDRVAAIFDVLESEIAKKNRKVQQDWPQRCLEQLHRSTRSESGGLAGRHFWIPGWSIWMMPGWTGTRIATLMPPMRGTIRTARHQGSPIWRRSAMVWGRGRIRFRDAKLYLPPAHYSMVSVPCDDEGIQTVTVAHRYVLISWLGSPNAGPASLCGV